MSCRRPQGCDTGGGQPGRLKLVRNDEVLHHIHRAEGDDRYLNSLARQFVCGEILSEQRKPVVQLLDGFACHGSGGVEHQHQRASGLWVVGKLDQVF